jgi:hypothetical protein
MVTQLKSLKLYGMAHALNDLAEQDSPAYQTSAAMLDRLLKAELAERAVRSVAYQLKSAKFPAYRDLSGFDFQQSVANEALAPAKPTLPPPSASRRSSSTAAASAVSPRSSWSTPWNRKNTTARPGNWPPGSCTLTWWSFGLV